MAQLTTTLNWSEGKFESSQSDLAPLAANELRVEVLYSAISNDDLLAINTGSTRGYFGTEIVGRVVAVGSAVGSRKVGEIVGVVRSNFGSGSGFATHLQLTQDEVVFIPSTIPLEQAASLLGTGVVAYKSLLRTPKGSPVAVVGSSHLAYLTVQFAKKVFGLHPTLFVTEGSNVEDFGAEAVELLTVDNIKKFNEKFESVVVTESLVPEIAKPIQNIALRTGLVYLAAPFGYNSQITVFDIIVGQREIIGVKRGDLKNFVKALEAAAFYGVKAKTEVIGWEAWEKAFERAKEVKAGHSVVLQFQ